MCGLFVFVYVEFIISAVFLLISSQNLKQKYTIKERKHEMSSSRFDYFSELSCFNIIFKCLNIQQRCCCLICATVHLQMQIHISSFTITNIYLLLLFSLKLLTLIFWIEIRLGNEFSMFNYSIWWLYRVLFVKFTLYLSVWVVCELCDLNDFFSLLFSEELLKLNHKSCVCLCLLMIWTRQKKKRYSL